MTEAMELDAAVMRLSHDYPQVPHDAVVSMLGDCYAVVVEASGQPLVGKAEQLARMRLDIRLA